MDSMATVQNDNGVVAPKECLIMISFNDGSAGENAEALARFLTNNNFPTFCTRIYCPGNAGNWRVATTNGVKTCKIYIPLLTNGWQKSKECQWETGIISKRIADQDVKVIPVYYEDFDEAYDDENDNHNYKLRWNDLQSVFREKGDEGKWMNTIISLLGQLPEVVNLDATKKPQKPNKDTANNTEFALQEFESEKAKFEQEQKKLELNLKPQRDEAMLKIEEEARLQGEASVKLEAARLEAIEEARDIKIKAEEEAKVQAAQITEAARLKAEEEVKLEAESTLVEPAKGHWVRKWFCCWASKGVCNSKKSVEGIDEVRVPPVKANQPHKICETNPKIPPSCTSLMQDEDSQSVEGIEEVGVPPVKKANQPHKECETNPKIPLPCFSLMQGCLSSSGSVVIPSIRPDAGEQNEELCDASPRVDEANESNHEEQNEDADFSSRKKN